MKPTAVVTAIRMESAPVAMGLFFWFKRSFSRSKISLIKKQYAEPVKAVKNNSTAVPISASLGRKAATVKMLTIKHAEGRMV